jgi:TonB family protein
VVDSACGTCGAPRTRGSSDGSLCPACLLTLALTETPADTEDEIEDDGLPPGTAFGSFLIQRPLGRGGMATVYEALETRLERSVALKVLPAEFLHDPTFARRFETEARLAARLEHPNIVPIYASGIENGVPWMSMRLLAGQNLSVLLRERRLPAREAVALLTQVAAALDHAHALGVVHRDIKPANILLDRAGVASVADFGLAQLMDSGVRLTRTGMLSGTPHYMAPEQALGQRVDHRCDIYALGIVAYEMLVGRTPFAGDSPVAVLLQQVNAPLPVPASDDLPAGCMKAITRATAKNPGDRWSSAGAFIEALASAIALAPAVHDAQAEHVRSRRVSPRTMAALAATAVLAMAAVLWLVVPRSDPGPISDAKVAALSEPGQQAPAAVPTPVPEPPAPTGSDGQTSSGGSSATKGEPKRDSSPKPEAPTQAPSEGPPDKEPPPPPPSPPSIGVVEGVGGLESLRRLPGVVPPAVPKDEFTGPRPIGKVQPSYPAAALTAKLEGRVTLQGMVELDGTVTEITVLQSPNKVFDQAAIDALKRFRFEPARRNGVSVRHPVTVPIDFVLGKN